MNLQKVEPDHKHSWVRYKRTDKTVWFKCNDPRCTSVMDRELLIGKLSLCPKCKLEEFELEREALKRKMPLCLNCRNTSESRRYKAVKAAIGDIFKESA